MPNLDRSLPAPRPRLSPVLAVAALWTVALGVPAASADPDASCSTANTMSAVDFAVDQVADGTNELEVDFYTDPSSGVHVWILQTLASQALGSDYARLTVFSGACASSAVDCGYNTDALAGTNGDGAAVYTAAVCIAPGPTWARVWYQDGGSTGIIDYALVHAVI